MVRDLVELGVADTPQYDPCEDEWQNAKMFPILEEEPEVTPLWGDQYVNAKILFLRRDRMARVTKISTSHLSTLFPIDNQTLLKIEHTVQASYYLPIFTLSPVTYISLPHSSYYCIMTLSFQQHNSIQFSYHEKGHQ